MVNYVDIKGFQDFTKYTEQINSNDPPVLFFFSGSKLPNGNSWCPDCVEAEPVVKAFLSELKKDITFVYVDVGDRDYWKDRACPFRTDSRTKLMVIPTIIKWKGVQRLEGSQCNNRELLQMLMEDED
ncbi:thioredoxin domain-containing protein 17-like isoform X2 [Danaus plexippus]|uniref:Thioredoxin domain-containing protein 17 n=1 Tax=Danaus plexippus plexippus TaxID=278856 RepID=A0A212FEU2_DANPL|nr:thioredoxin domain-containing protein 17-like isoform X2 [Danaus plexippus]OWR52275.1 thioredoxin domain-containing protein 17 [Danaus plexippus plexippus]